MTDAVKGAALTERFAGDIEGEFWVPAYQRGYRWTPDDVRRLLDDVLESNGSDYYLQPIVVKEYPGGKWELIDGQQRLTTLFLILAFMQRQQIQNAEIAFFLEYETRPEMAGYLSQPHDVPASANIDAFHVDAAYKTISEWFAGHGARQNYIGTKIYQYFFESVRVIWYEAPSSIDSTTVFTRLNVGRIPLTDAELVKALLLSPSETAAGPQARTFEMAAQWDSIERRLRDQELWAFLTSGRRNDSSHINLILDLLAGGPYGRDRPQFHTFETLRHRIESNPREFWNSVLDLESTFIGWFEDRDTFHRVGFLVADGDELAELLALSKNRSKQEFAHALIERVRSRLGLTRATLEELTYASGTMARAERALFLMNVETVRRHNASSERYSFHQHSIGHWSLEHIHAQNAETLTRQEQWRAWLRLHRDAIAALGAGSFDTASILDRIDQAVESSRLGAETFREIEEEVRRLLGGDTEDVHSITNLALLDAETNSALNNSVFEVKRQEILRRDRTGQFIPPCTRNVFLKYYTASAGQQNHFWGPADRAGYLEAMVVELTPYFEEPQEDMFAAEGTPGEYL